MLTKITIHFGDTAYFRGLYNAAHSFKFNWTQVACMRISDQVYNAVVLICMSVLRHCVYKVNVPLILLIIKNGMEVP